MRRALQGLMVIVVAALFWGAGILAGGAAAGRGAASSPAVDLAPTPPMGWNSYDAYCGDVTEQEVKANTDFMAAHMARLGWNYVVIDYYWYFSYPLPDRPHDQWEYNLDEYGRLIPAPNRFPSAAHGQGFRPLADYIHSKGLKFGIHIMRGIPRAAVERNLPILGTSAHAADVVEGETAADLPTSPRGKQFPGPVAFGKMSQ